MPRGRTCPGLPYYYNICNAEWCRHTYLYKLVSYIREFFCSTRYSIGPHNVVPGYCSISVLSAGLSHTSRNSQSNRSSRSNRRQLELSKAKQLHNYSHNLSASNGGAHYGVRCCRFHRNNPCSTLHKRKWQYDILAGIDAQLSA